MQDRIVLRNVARVLNDSELDQVSGGWVPGPEEPESGTDQPGGGGGKVTSGEPTKRVSSQDPNGPMDEDKSAADW